MARLLQWFAASRYTIPLIFGLSFLLRCVWVLNAHTEGPLRSEIHQVAVSLARTGVIADAYRVDHVPTTHVGPIAPVLAGTIYRVFGADSLVSEAILFIVATLVLFATMLVLDRAFARLGESALARRLAIAIFLVVPVDLNMETQDFRIREGNEATLLLAGVLLAVLALDRAPQIRWRSVIGLAALCAFLFLLSPAVAVPAYAACGVLVLRRFRPRQWPAVAGIAAGFVMLFSLPWAIRNHDLLGQWVWSRGNVGLEMAIGTYPGAVDPVDPGLTFRKRLHQVHPFQSVPAYAEMRAEGGELAYSHRLGALTKAWASRHPAEAAHIWVRHVREFFAPPPWLWSAASRPPLVDRLRSIHAMLILIVAAAGIGVFLARGRWLYFYPLVMIVTAVIPYIGPQPRTRYRYTITALLVFTATAATVRALTALYARLGYAGASAPHDANAPGP